MPSIKQAIKQHNADLLAIGLLGEVIMLFNKLVLASFFTFAFSISHAQIDCGADLKNLGPGGRRLSVPIERFSKPIDLITKTIEGSKSFEESLEALVKTDGRGALFQLEGLLKIYSKIFPDDLKPWKEKVKALEDAFGAYTEKVEFFEAAQKLKDIPKEALTILEKPIAEKKTALRKALLFSEWLTEDGKMGPTWNDLKESIVKQDWSSKEEDGDLFVEVIIDEMKVVRDALDNGEYSPYKLQDGVHELRRQLRWFLIYFQAGNGLFKLIMPRVGMDLKDYAYLINEPIAKSRFSKLPENPRIDDPYTMPFHYFLALSMKVQEIGETKSNAELFDALEAAFLSAKLAKTKAEAKDKVSKIFKANDRPVTYASRAESLINEMVNSEMLKHIRKWLKIQLNGGEPLEE